MPSLLVVGADHLGNMPEQLANIGFDDVMHLSDVNLNRYVKEYRKK